MKTYAVHMHLPGMTNPFRITGGLSKQQAKASILALRLENKASGMHCTYARIKEVDHEKS